MISRMSNETWLKGWRDSSLLFITQLPLYVFILKKSAPVKAALPSPYSTFLPSFEDLNEQEKRLRVDAV